MKGVACFKELHANGMPHFHVVLVAGSKSTAWGRLDGGFKERGFTPDIRAVVTPPGSDPLWKVLRYLMIPRGSKISVDEHHYQSRNFEMPSRLISEAAAAKKRLDTKPATADEAFQYICSHKHVVSYDTFLGHIAKASHDDVGAQRVSRPINASVGGNVASLVGAMLHRRDRVSLQEELAKSPLSYVVENVKGVCGCAGVVEEDGSTGTVFEDVGRFLDMHGSAIETCYTRWYTMFFCSRLHGKKRALVVTGPPDTGKSYFGSLVASQFPDRRVFLPLAGSEFCWDGLEEGRHLLAFANDWRFSKDLPVQPCLNWLEGLPFKRNRKHKDPVQSKGPIAIFTSNNMEAGWSRVDVGAFQARVNTSIECVATFVATKTPMKLAVERLGKCKKCAACALLWKSPVLLELVRKENAEVGAIADAWIAAMIPVRKDDPASSSCVGVSNSAWGNMLREAGLE